LLAVLACAAAVVPGRAQVANPPAATAPTVSAATLAKYDKNNNGKLDPEELAAMQADEAKAKSIPTETKPAGDAGETIVLSPFEVSAEEDKGYLASSTMSGTRLNSKLEDLGASITVVTRQQMLDTAAVDLNDLFLYEANTEGTGQFTNSSVNVNGLTTDEVQQSPQTSNRIRGIGNANMSVGGFESNSRIPVDTYNLDSVEISRGANSNLFGLGNASGTVNLNQGQGNLGRDTTSFSLRGDTWDGFRASLSINRVVIKNKLAVRADALYDSKGFQRKPSEDVQRRQYAAITYRPFRSTTLKGSAEFMNQRRQTPNSQTPRDTISFWMESGRPTWDPITQTVHYPDGRPSVFVGTVDGNLPAGLGLDTTQYSRPSMYIDNGQVQLWTPNRNSTNGNPSNTGGAARIIGTYTDIIRSRSTLYPLFVQPSVSNQNIYNWEDINFAATNWNTDKAATYNVSLDQRLFQNETHQSFLNLAWRREMSSTYNRNTIRETSFLYIDINERLLDGTANPYFLRPYVTVWDGSNPSRDSDDTEFVRAQLSYELDLRRKSRWISWLGQQRAVGFYESKFVTTKRFNSRETMIEGKPWMTAANLLNLSGIATGHASYKFYLGDNQGYNVDYGPIKSGFATGKYNFRYLSVPATNTFVDDPTLFGETPISASRNRNERHTRGANLQSFFLQGRIVTTVGTREDQTRGRGTPGIQAHSDGLFYWEDLGDRGWNSWTYRSGKTKTKQIVVKPLRNWRKIDQLAESPGLTGWTWDFLRSISVYENRSDSFQPDATGRKNLFGEVLPDPNGQNRDHGVQFEMFQGKLTARINWYKTEQKSTRISGGASTAHGRTVTLDTGGSGFSMYRWARDIVSLRPAMANATEEQIVSETYKLMQLPNDWFEQFNGFNVTDVNDVTGTGAEYELTFNPSNAFRLKFTASRQQTVDSNLSNTLQEWIDYRMPAWTTIKDDAGNLWWTSTTASNWYNNNIVPTLKLARANLGLPRSQIKKWQWSATANYTVQRNAWGVERLGDWGQKLVGLTVGTTIRWADKSSIGFYGMPDSDGIMRTYDVTRPIYDPARASYDLLLAYNLRFFQNKIRARLQLNGSDIFSHQGLRAVSTNPDGTPTNFRILDGPKYTLTTTFDF
jgi:hypothetical protein